MIRKKELRSGFLKTLKTRVMKLLLRLKEENRGKPIKVKQ